MRMRFGELRHSSKPSVNLLHWIRNDVRHSFTDEPGAPIGIWERGDEPIKYAQ